MLQFIVLIFWYASIVQHIGFEVLWHLSVKIVSFRKKLNIKKNFLKFRHETIYRGAEGLNRGKFYSLTNRIVAL